MFYLQVGSIPWLKVIKSNSLRQLIVAKLWHWIIEEIVICIIKVCIQADIDTAFYFQRIVYNEAPDRHPKLKVYNICWTDISVRVCSYLFEPMSF